MKLTKAQSDAIEIQDQNLIVVAGAGSGKTHVLVSRYLNLLDKHPDWSLNQLVAITYTEKAAQEMRDRVRQALEKRLNQADDSASVMRWSQRLAEMDSARIGTIHALCAALLRANAAEAGVDPAFDVLDETEAPILRDAVIDTTLRQLVTEGHPALALFTEYGASSVHETIQALISTELDDLPPDLFEKWTERWQVDAVNTLERLVTNPDLMAAAARVAPANLPSGSDKLLDVCRLCNQLLPQLASTTPFDGRLAALNWLADEIKLNAGSTPFWGGKDSIAEIRDVLRAIRETVRAARDEIGSPPGEIDRRAAELLPLWLDLLRRMQSAYRDAKRENSILDFDDLERGARYLLKNHEGVRARYLGAEFKHVLVDEFQDTNAAQWDIIQQIASPTQPGSLFIVGDAKQSIYAFRGADVSVFERVRHYLTAPEVGGRPVMLSRSFRTHRPLVETFNELFGQILTRDPNSPIRDYQIERGEPMEAERQQSPADLPSVELMIVGGDLRANEKRQVEADELARRIVAMVEAEVLVYDRKRAVNRPVGYGDFALLFQAMSYATLYEAALKARGVPYVTIAGRGYYDRQEVWDCIHLLNALYHPADELALAAALRSPLFSLSDEALLALRLHTDANDAHPPLWAMLRLAGEQDIPGVDAEQRKRIAFAASLLDDLRAAAGRVAIADLLRAALAQTGYLAVLTGLPDGARRRGNLEKLINLAQSSGRATLSTFSHYLRDLSEREAREGEALIDAADAVTLMTVHKSKGLEFPVVALVDISWARGDRNRALLVNDPAYGLCCAVSLDDDSKTKPYIYRRARQLAELREDAESRRKLYVAMTRAQDFLLISGQASWNDKEQHWKAKGWLEWLLPLFGVVNVPPGDDFDIPYGGDALRVRTLAADAPASADMTQTRAGTGWNMPPPDDLPAELPPLLRPLRIQRDAPARALTATQIASLGAAMETMEPERAFYRHHFRRSVLHSAPAHITRASSRRTEVSRRKIGEIVHRALRWWRFPISDADMTEMLRSYAWQEGIVEPELLDDAVQRARRALKNFTTSDVFGWIEAAAQVYRELPFIYQTDERTIYGVIDTLLRRNNDTWAIIDYKTGYVPAGTHEQHAARYHLQVGVYAAAVREQLRQMTGREVVPEVFIHYIRDAATVTVPTHVWEAVLKNLEGYIGDLTG